MVIYLLPNLFGNVSNKKRWPVVEGDDIRFITSISGSAAKDDQCAGFTIKWSTYNSHLGSHYAYLIILRYED